MQSQCEFSWTSSDCSYSSSSTNFQKSSQGKRSHLFCIEDTNGNAKRVLRRGEDFAEIIRNAKR
jgi:hypothetical protein